jgi:hypothetical protein
MDYISRINQIVVLISGKFMIVLNQPVFWGSQYLYALGQIKFRKANTYM